MADARPATETRAGLPVLACASAALREPWLRRQPAGSSGLGSSGLWRKLARQAAGVASVTKREAIDVALCHGWIDGQLNPDDHSFWLVRCMPRTAGSRWSQTICSTVPRLMDAGRMAPSGLAQVQAAHADGRWDGAYAPQSQAVVPPDLQRGLDAHPAARDFLATLTGANRYAVRDRIQHTSSAATRHRRIQHFTTMRARGEVAHAPRPGAVDKPGA